MAETQIPEDEQPLADDAEAAVATPDLELDAARESEWSALLDYLHTARGFDFHGYKRTSLMRRVLKRLEALGISSFAAYQDYLEVHPEEFTALFNSVLINVTSFFRDPAAWEALQTTVIPQLLACKPAGEPIRAWSAGCASGEEAYTLAIVLAEALGLDEFRERVKIYATDVDDDALTQARQATYNERKVQGVPPALLEKYFERNDDTFTFRKDLRRFVIFGRHDLMQDAPISRIDLLLSRNALMYFNAEAQSRILARFHFALNDGGYLFLGRAETLMAHGGMFAPIDLRRRISIKVPRTRAFERMPPAAAAAGRDSTPEHRLMESALDASPIAQMLVDRDGQLALANDRARTLFGLGPGDIGRPLQDLRLSYRPVELRSVIEQSGVERRPVALRDVEWQSPAGEVRWFDIQVSAMSDGGGAALGTSVSFTDVTAFKRLQRELENSNQELETAYEELQSTNEELETTNEELQSTVEELETTNEELQSTNEELETMNEELQSTNEELQTINDELRLRSEEVHDTNAYLASVLSSLRGGVAVLDRELRVLDWTRHAEELWGLRAPEVTGQHFLNLDIGLPVERLRPALRSCIAGDLEVQDITLDAVNRRGRGIRCQIRCAPLLGSDGDLRGAILLMDAADQSDGAEPGRQ
jgi:two-component system, chemotaxis family, CheB/CheR fusion protein